MGNVMAWVKEHPYLTGIAVFIVGVIVLIMMLPSGGTQDRTAEALAAQEQARSSAVQSGNALQAMQLQGQQFGQAVGADVTKNAQDNATTLAIANLQKDMATNQAQTDKEMLDRTSLMNERVAAIGAQVSTLTAGVVSKNAEYGFLQGMFNILAADTPPMIINDQIVVGPEGQKTHSYSQSGSPGQLLTGNFDGKNFYLSLMPTGR